MPEDSFHKARPNFTEVPMLMCTVQTLVRIRVLRCLMRVYTVCEGPLFSEARPQQFSWFGTVNFFSDSGVFVLSTKFKAVWGSAKMFLRVFRTYADIKSPDKPALLNSLTQCLCFPFTESLYTEKCITKWRHSATRNEINGTNIIAGFYLYRNNHYRKLGQACLGKQCRPRSDAAFRGV